MACSKEEIERKRLAALQKRQNKLSTQYTAACSPVKLNSPSTSYSFNKTSAASGSLRNSNNYNSKNFHPYSKPDNIVQNSCNTPLTKVVSGTIYLISEDRFEVNPSEFCAPLINIFKTIPSRKYDASTKLWNFSIEHHQELMSKVAPLAPHVVLGPLPSYVLMVLQEQMMDPQVVDLSPIEATLRHKLMPFQEDGFWFGCKGRRWLELLHNLTAKMERPLKKLATRASEKFGIARRGRCMIADDMGLGKTFQALAIAAYYRHNWPLLIVTTSSMRETWQSKIHELLPSVPLMNIVTLTTGKDAQLVADRQTEIVIVSYKIAAMHTELLKNKKFGAVIIDESHYLKSHKAQCTIALTSVTRHASRVVLLSGTPALSRPAELYTQLALIHPKLFPSFTDYGKRYCAGKQTNFGWDMTGQSNLAELQILLQKKFLIRRTKEQVLTELEGKVRESVMLDQSLLQFSKEEEQGLSQLASRYKTTKASERHAALITFFSESATVKIPAICKYIKQLVKEFSGKFLVFAHHRNMIDAICVTLDEACVHYICIVGSTPPASRAELVDKFQYSECCRVAVLSITAANSGLTLTAASLVVFAELHWNPGILTQAESRAHRIGQSGGVRVRYLLAAGTVDDHMWPMLQDKLNVLNDVGLSGDTFEDTKMSHQKSKTNISQYLSQSPSCTKNMSDYIPGTNIRKFNEGKENKHRASTSNSMNESHQENSTNQVHQECSLSDCHQNPTTVKDSGANNNSLNASDLKSEDFTDSMCEDIDKTFFDDDEGDQLLANLDL